MVFNHAQNINASGSNFSDIGRDQNIIIHFSGQQLNLKLTNAHNASNDASGLTPCSVTSSHPLTVTQTYHASGVVYVVDTSANLIVQIVQSLIGFSTGDQYRGLKLELGSLQQTLTLTRVAIQVYEYTPLGRSLANIIYPEVEQCRVVLQQLLDEINGYRKGLEPTSIRHLWRQVWWSKGEVDELVSSRAKLAARQRLLGEFLMALNSDLRTELGHGSQAGRASLADFRNMLRQGPTSLRHLQVSNILVVDHLGRNILVPTLFCSTWENFNYLINGYCKGQAGNGFVKRGDYQVVRAEDNRIIGPSEFVTIVAPGMVFEMSIVMRQNAAFQDNLKKCPRCHHVNSNLAPINGWIECRNCAGQFQVVNSTENHDGSPGGNHADDNEIISPEARTTGRNAVQRATDKNSSWVNDETSFFRRIHLICTGGGATRSNLEDSPPRRTRHRRSSSSKRFRYSNSGNTWSLPQRGRDRSSSGSSLGIMVEPPSRPHSRSPDRSDTPFSSFLSPGSDPIPLLPDQPPEFEFPTITPLLQRTRHRRSTSSKSFRSSGSGDTWSHPQRSRDRISSGNSLGIIVEPPSRPHSIGSHSPDSPSAPLFLSPANHSIPLPDGTPDTLVDILPMPAPIILPDDRLPAGFIPTDSFLFCRWPSGLLDADDVASSSTSSSSSA